MPQGADDERFDRLRRRVRRDIRMGLAATQLHLEGVVARILAESRQGLEASAAANRRELQEFMAQTLAEHRRELETAAVVRQREADEAAAEHRQGLEAALAEHRRELDAAAGATRQELESFVAQERQEPAAFLGRRISENPQQFEVLVEDLRGQMRILAEGIIGVDRKLDRFRGEVHDEFARVDRRLLRLEARFLTG